MKHLKRFNEEFTPATVAIGLAVAYSAIQLLKYVGKSLLKHIGLNMTVEPDKLKKIVTDIIHRSVIKVIEQRGHAIESPLYKNLTDEFATVKTELFNKIDSGEITKLGQVMEEFENYILEKE